MRTQPTFVKGGDGHRPRVFLDGVEQRFVFEADTQAGYLVRGVKSRWVSYDGEKPFDDDALHLERVEGVVTFAWEEPVA